jgi:hypothetical protein
MRFASIVLSAVSIAALVLSLDGAAWAQTPEEPEPGAPRVHLDATNGRAILFRVPGPAERARLGPIFRDRGVPLCHPPCGVIVDGRDGALFYVEDVRAGNAGTERFQLLSRTGDVTVRVGSRGQRAAGIALTATGGAGMGASLITFLVLGLVQFGDELGNALGAALGGHPSPVPSFTSGYVAAGVVGVGGVAALITGIGLLIDSRRRVEIHPTPSIPLAGSARLEGGVLRF